MLNIFIGENNIPENLKTVYDNETAFRLIGLNDGEDCKRILREIEYAEYIDSASFKDRFGYRLYSDVLSTGTKTLINIISDNTSVFFGGELGANARHLLMTLKEGNVFFRSGYDKLDFENVAVMVNGVCCNNPLEFEEVMDNA
jgi:hypothetical protein